MPNIVITIISIVSSICLVSLAIYMFLQRNKYEKLLLNKQQIIDDTVEFNEGLIRLFGTIYTQTEKICNHNHQLSEISTTLEADFSPGQEHDVIDAICQPNVMRPYIDFVGNKAKLCVVPAKEVAKWYLSLVASNNEFVALYQTDFVQLCKKFENILSTDEEQSNNQ